MSSAESVDACRSRSRWFSIIGAVVVFLLVWLVIGWAFWIGLILGVVAYFVLSWFLGRSCDKAAEEAARATEREAAARKDADAKSAAARASETKAAPAVATAKASPTSEAEAMDETASPEAPAAHWSADVAADSGKTSDTRGQGPLKPSAALTDEETLRDGVGAWRYEGASESDAKSDGPADTPAAEPATANAPEATDAGSADVSAAAGEQQPVTLTAARDGNADDLKRIKGVGPGLEKTLNELGFFHFDQIAAWTGTEVEWVDARLKFKGRIVRDDWIGQAKTFAAGG